MIQAEMSNSLVVAIDFETHLISEEQPIPKPICLSWHDGKDTGLLIGDSEIEPFLKEVLSSNKKIVAHNFSFEACVILKYYPSLCSLLFKAGEAQRLFCTKIYEQLIANTAKKPSMGFSLAFLVNQYFAVDISEDKKDTNSWRYRYAELDGVPKNEWPQKAIDYAIEDSIWAYKLMRHQREHYPNLKYSDDVEAEYCLNMIGKFGMLISKERVEVLEREIDEKLDPGILELLQLGFIKVDKRGKKTKNIKALREYILENFENHKTTDSGAVAISGEAIDEYLNERPDDPVLSLFQNNQKYEKMKTAYVSRLKQANPYMRTEYNSVVATNRTSSRSSENFASVNIQQMPRTIEGVTYDIRNCFAPRPGFKIVSSDYVNNEMAACANQLYQTFGRSKMRDAVNSGNRPADLHSLLATRLMNKYYKKDFKVTYREFIKLKKQLPYKKYREMAKPLDLSFPGGVGYDTMRTMLFRAGIVTKLKVMEIYDNKWSLQRDLFNFRYKFANLRGKQLAKNKWALVYDELVGMKAELFKLYPELEEFLKDEHKKFQTGEVKYIKNEFGEWESEDMYRYVVRGVRRDWCTYTAFCNGFLMQTPAAIGAKKAFVKIVKEFWNNPLVHILAFIHDEIVFEVINDDRMFPIIRRINEIMIDEMQVVTPHVRVATDTEVMDYWAKAGGFWSEGYLKNPYDKKLYLLSELPDEDLH